MDKNLLREEIITRLTEMGIKQIEGIFSFKPGDYVHITHNVNLAEQIKHHVVKHEIMQEKLVDILHEMVKTEKVVVSKEHAELFLNLFFNVLDLDDTEFYSGYAN